MGTHPSPPSLGGDSGIAVGRDSGIAVGLSYARYHAKGATIHPYPKTYTPVKEKEEEKLQGFSSLVTASC